MQFDSVITIGVVILIGWVIFSTPITMGDAPDGTKKVKTSSNFDIKMDNGDADETIKIYDDETGENLGYLFVKNGRVFEPDGTDIEENRFKTERVVNKYLVEFEVDLGVWSGVYIGKDSGIDRIQTGARCSPAKLLYGAVSPDIVFSQETAGIGASFYVPSESIPSFWNKIGAGAWYCVPYDGNSDPDWCIGLTTSFTR
jgi:hypothetical protein